MWDRSNNQKGKIRIGCDNLAGVLDSSQTALKTKRSKTFRAILRAIKKYIAALKRNRLLISLSHIKGHQDDTENFQILRRWSQLNVMVDHKAKQNLTEFILQGNEVKSSSFHFPADWQNNKQYIVLIYNKT